MRTVLPLCLCVVALTFAACRRDAPEPEGDGSDGPEALRLPETCYGTWELTGTSGGMTGSGYDGPEGIRLILSKDNVAERRAPGQPAARSDFGVRRGRTIFSSEPGWFIDAAGIGLAGVVEISEDGRSLSISDNHPDGFNRHYRRAE